MSQVVVRGFRPSDVQAVVEVINASNEADGVPRRETVATFETMHPDPLLRAEDHFAVAEVGSVLVGFSRIRREVGTRLVVGVRVLPAWRGKDVERALLQWLIPRARGLPERVLDVAVWGVQPELAAVLEEELGFRFARSWWLMRVDLSGPLALPVLPTGVTLREFVPGRDEEMLTALINEVFHDHWGEGTHFLEEVKHSVGEPCFDPGLLLFAEAGEEAVGYVWSWADPGRRSAEGSAVAYIGDLGVVSGYRGRGLGRALLLRALNDLRERGFAAADLEVDEPNAVARRLYESVGFREFLELRWYRREIGEGPPGGVPVDITSD